MSLPIAHKQIQPSSATADKITNTATATAFTKTIPLPAGTISKGTRIIGTASPVTEDANSTNTFLYQVYLGPVGAAATGILLAESTALDGTDGDVCTLQFQTKCTKAGTVSVAEFTGGGLAFYNGATAMSKTRSYARATDAQVGTTIDLEIAVVVTQSAADPGNISRLDDLDILIFPPNPSE